jgi:hypothetical protein
LSHFLGVNEITKDPNQLVKPAIKERKQSEGHDKQAHVMKIETYHIIYKIKIGASASHTYLVLSPFQIIRHSNFLLGESKHIKFE